MHSVPPAFTLAPTGAFLVAELRGQPGNFCPPSFLAALVQQGPRAERIHLDTPGSPPGRGAALCLKDKWRDESIFAEAIENVGAGDQGT
jgi:hypothetical protein